MRIASWSFVLCALSALAQGQGRIISTSPSFTESLYALGAGDGVVAVSQYCHYPPAVDRLPRVGSYLQPNIEEIARLQPDLVLVHADQKQALTQLKNLGIRTLALRNTSLEETLSSIRLIGEALGVSKKATDLERDIRAKLRSIEKKSEGTPRRSLLFVVGRTPGRLDGMIAVGKGSFLNEIIQIAGGRNVLADSPVAYPRISLEAVMRLDPDVIVDMGEMAVTTGVTERHIRAVEELWATQTAVRAAAHKHVHSVAADIYVVPGPRMVEAAESFARMLSAKDTQ